MMDRNKQSKTSKESLCHGPDYWHHRSTSYRFLSLRECCWTLRLTHHLNIINRYSENLTTVGDLTIRSYIPTFANRATTLQDRSQLGSTSSCCEPKCGFIKDTTSIYELINKLEHNYIYASMPVPFGRHVCMKNWRVQSEPLDPRILDRGGDQQGPGISWM